jgi:RNA polymerase sigma-70 factor (ECF subfamily)
MIDWEDIAKRHGPLVWRTVYRLLGTGPGAVESVRECFQETFVTALDYARRNDVRNWPGLLQRIATTRALDVIASRKAERSRRIGNNLETNFDRVPSPRAGPEAAAEHAETMDRFRVALADLPAGQREAFSLRHFSQMSYEEIANETGLSIDAVGVAIHRARGRLKESLAMVLKNETVAVVQRGCGDV